MSSDRNGPGLISTLAVAMFLQVAALFIREWVSREMIDGGTEPSIARLKSALIGFAALLVLILPLLLKRRRTWRPYLACPRNPLRTLVAAIVIGIAIRLVSWGVVILQSALIDGAAWPDYVAPIAIGLWQCPDIAYAGLFLFTMATITPVVEELLSRGLILGSLLAVRPAIAVPVSALLFTILHKPDDMPLAFAFGMVAAVMLRNSQSLWGPITAHAIVNALLLLVPGCFKPYGLSQALLAMPAECRGTVGVLLIALPLAAAFRLARRPGAGR